MDVITSVAVLLFAGALMVAVIFFANRAVHAAHNSESLAAKSRIARGFARELFVLGCAVIVVFLAYMAVIVATDSQVDLRAAAPGLLTLVAGMAFLVPVAWFSALVGARFIIGADPGPFLNRSR